MTAKHEKPHPCWYCNKPVEVAPRYSDGPFTVVCVEPGHICMGPSRSTKAGAIKAWNERKPQ